MINSSIEKLSLKIQISKDFAKLFAVLEKTFIACLMIAIVFFLMEKAEITSAPASYGVIAGTVGAFVAFAKKMYYDQALSELNLASHIDQQVIDSVVTSIGYKKESNDKYASNKKLFSLFFHCESEFITIKKRGDTMALIGPYDKMTHLYKLLAN